MCIKNTHFKCLKSYYRISRIEVTHLFLECRHSKKRRLMKNSSILHDLIDIDIDDFDNEIETPITPLGKFCLYVLTYIYV